VSGYNLLVNAAQRADGVPATSPSADAVEIGRLVLELIHAGHATTGSTVTAPTAHGAHGPDEPRLSRQAIRVSIVLYQRGGLTMHELAAATGMSAGWASRVVEELVTAGLAERAADQHDRRLVHVRLVPSSRVIVETAYRSWADAITRALSALDPAGRRAVRAFLARVVEELSAS
jgi:DNA-binding MarR family transcriptional regulator